MATDVRIQPHIRFPRATEPEIGLKDMRKNQDRRTDGSINVTSLDRHAAAKTRRLRPEVRSDGSITCVWSEIGCYEGKETPFCLHILRILYKALVIPDQIVT
jgi:hypothetical protein